MDLLMQNGEFLLIHGHLPLATQHTYPMHLQIMMPTSVNMDTGEMVKVN